MRLIRLQPSDDATEGAQRVLLQLLQSTTADTKRKARRVQQLLLPTTSDANRGGRRVQWLPPANHCYCSAPARRDRQQFTDAAHSSHSGDRAQP